MLNFGSVNFGLLKKKENLSDKASGYDKFTLYLCKYNFFYFWLITAKNKCCNLEKFDKRRLLIFLKLSEVQARKKNNEVTLGEKSILDWHSASKHQDTTSHIIGGTSLLSEFLNFELSKTGF